MKHNLAAPLLIEDRTGRWSVFLKVLSEVGAVVQQVEKRLVHKPTETATNGFVLVEVQQLNRMIWWVRKGPWPVKNQKASFRLIFLPLINRGFVSLALEAFSLSGQVYRSDPNQDI